MRGLSAGSGSIPAPPGAAANVREKAHVRHKTHPTPRRGQSRVLNRFGGQQHLVIPKAALPLLHSHGSETRR